ncbi:MAG: hypothetical protein N0C84_00750 [Candidatus Thiodiazotropha taylori]|uniref:Uncharacterized protein n=1 Tax=Candidatus Thiodiazotropha taylori TaxID=2792791 RepID=A0A9E4KAR1_9GAMM|nr:hypothetical protein [Candidatus Thiodiazotropha taylori]MCW4254974.1 hypothetical protein [Candidatus Thiodiazotropha taylori]
MNDFHKFAIDNLLIEEEYRRIDAQLAQGEQSIMVQHDMGKWAKATGVWGTMHYSHIVEAFAEARGWTQKDFTGLEIIDDAD